MKDHVQVGRLAFRAEGENWNAYYALPDTMNDAIPLGSIRLAAVENNPTRKAAFMSLMREIVSDVVAERCGIRPAWGWPRTAPEHERKA